MNRPMLPAGEPAHAPEGLGWGSGLASDTTGPLLPPAEAPRLRRRRRRRGLASLLICTVLPTALVGGYEYGVAADQYASSFRFVVRQQTPPGAGPGGASLGAALAGGNPMLAAIQDPEVVVSYIGSHQILHDLKGRLPIQRIYATRRADWFARLSPYASSAALLREWRAMVVPSFDLTSGVVTVRVRAFTPEAAQAVAVAVLGAAEHAVNAMSHAARTRALAAAEATVARGRARLTADEVALARYRNAHRLLYPQLAASASSGVTARLRGQLAQDRATLGMLTAAGQGAASLQVRILRQRIAATAAEINRLDATVAAPAAGTGPGGASGGVTGPLASVLSGYDRLAVNAKLDERLYASDLQALQAARSAATQQAVSLEAFVRPNRPDGASYPRRWLITLEAALAAFVAWCLGMLLFQGLRDHLD